MFGGKKPGMARIETLIGKNTEVEGNVTFTGGLHVDGCIKGNVIGEKETLSVLTLSENGRIEGEVNVPNVILNGTVFGDIHAYERLELEAKARVTGDVYCELIEMAIGASVNGRLTHTTVDKSKPTLVKTYEKTSEKVHRSK